MKNTGTNKQKKKKRIKKREAKMDYKFTFPKQLLHETKVIAMTYCSWFVLICCSPLPRKIYLNSM